jgi:signal transduction histidine kinase/integral membrane sensor domain MASE1
MNRASEAWPAERPADIGSPAGPGGPLIRLLDADLPGTLLAAGTVAVAYAATAWAGTAFIFPGARVSALWFPNAILLAALLLARRRDWWIYLASVLPAHFLVMPLLVSVSPTRAVIGYLGNCATALLGALALSAAVPGIRRIDRLRTAIVFILLAGVLAPLCTSLLVAAAALAAGISPTFWWMAIARSLTNTFAILTLVPLILHGTARLRQGKPTIHPARATEATVLVITLATLGMLAFVVPESSNQLSPALLYAPFAILLWGTVRFGVPGACGPVLLLGILATWGALNQTGPFSAHAPAENTVALLLFLGITGGSLLLLAAALEERKCLEQSGAASEARFRTIFAHSIMPTVIWHTDGRILDANESFFRLTGYDHEDLRSGRLSTRDLIARAGSVGLPDPPRAVPDLLSEVPLERELLLRDGRHIPVLIGGCRFPGSAAEGTAYVFDLSSLRRAQSQRRQAERLHSAVLASIHDQIVVLDQVGVIIETNQSWRRFVEHAATRPFERGQVGEHYLQACVAAAQEGDADARELLQCIRDVLGGVSIQRRLEFSRDTVDGLLWYEISIERLHRPEGGAVITRSDITAHKRAIAQAREQRQQLAHLGRAAVLGELSGAFAHELAQPLTSILGNAEAALELLPADTPGLTEIRDILRDIIKDDVRAAEVIQRLRSMLTQGEIQRRPVDLNQVVREVLALARGDLITRNVSVVTQLDPQAALVLADPVQLQQVLLNLIVNACEAMSGSPLAERRLTIATRQVDEGRAIECSVADCGCGISRADSERIFQPFVTTKKQGLGLGLAICRSIVEAHGGRLWAENASEGCGAIFRFTANIGA